MGQPFLSVFAAFGVCAFVNGLVAETPGTTGLADVENGMAERISQAAHRSDRGGSVSRDVDNPRDPPEGGSVRTPVRYRMRTPDPALPEDAQSINKLAHTADE